MSRVGEIREEGVCVSGEDEFSSALRSAIDRRGLSLGQISHQLRSRGRPVSISSISHWQSGRSRPVGPQSLGALAAMEEILGADPGTLMNRVGPPRQRGRAAQHSEISDFVPASDEVRDALAALGFIAPEDYPHERFVHQLSVIDGSNSVQTTTSRIMVRALREGKGRLPAVQVLDEDEPNVPPSVIALEGCSIGRTLTWPERRTYGSEILIDGHLEVGQQAVLAYRMEMSAKERNVRGMFYTVPRRAHDIMIEIEFRGPSTPVDCERYRRNSDGESVMPVRLDANDRIQVAESSFGPGLLGLRWGWEGEDG